MQIAPGMHFPLSQTCLPPTRPGGDGYTGKEGWKTLRDPPLFTPPRQRRIAQSKRGKRQLKKKGRNWHTNHQRFRNNCLVLLHMNVYTCMIFKIILKIVTSIWEFQVEGKLRHGGERNRKTPSSSSRMQLIFSRGEEKLREESKEERKKRRKKFVRRKEWEMKMRVEELN